MSVHARADSGAGTSARLATNTHYAWEPADHKLSQVVATYFANFVKTGDPNGSGLPTWPAHAPEEGFKVMRLDVESGAVPDARPRYLLLDEVLRTK